jgi:hypothetical protein
MMKMSAHRLKTLALAVAMSAITSLASAQESILPSAANPGVSQFDDPNIVYMADPETPNAPLAIFLAGTNGRSQNAPKLLLNTIRQQGYRVIYLSYDDAPAGTVLCVRQAAGCYAGFRASRSFGGEGPVQTPAAEAIAQRLGDLLRYLRRAHPDQGWDAYLDAQGAPAWPRIVLSGLSQGAGMAAFIAKLYPVERVVLFSSPWDAEGRDKHPAQWLSSPSATPPERWWAERHVREKTTDLLEHAYAVLQIPADHILLFDGELPAGGPAGGENPYHTTTVRLPQYVPQWRQMYGRAAP